MGANRGLTTRRLPWQLAAAAILLAFLTVLATLQYRWLGAVSDAERDRMRTSLRVRASDLTREFDAELTRTFVAFHVDGDALEHDAAGTLAAAWQRWRSQAPAPDVVRAIFLVEGKHEGHEEDRTEGARRELRRLDLERRVLEPAEWPPDLAAVFTPERLPTVPSHPAVPLPLFLADAIDARLPALFVPVPFIKKVTTGPHFTLVAGVPGTERVVVVALDRDRLERNLLEPLVTKYFGDPHASEYLVTVARNDASSAVLFASGDAPLSASSADVSSGFFKLRPDAVDRLVGEESRTQGSKTERFAITFMRRTGGGSASVRGGGEQGPPEPDQSGAWQLRVRHRSGSLDAIVAQSRRRNLAISVSVLGLLGASVVLIVAAAQRQQHLARQQMEFVAAVSHELRTPLAVICSAGENLADGVVADEMQVKRYGSLIQSEGRRLRDMVERVLEFGGIASTSPVRFARGSPEQSRRARPHDDVDLSEVIADAIEAVKPDASERGVTLSVHLTPTPHISGDAAALRSAVVNVVGNSVKYSPRGGNVDVSLTVVDDMLRLSVVDRGLGIDRGDLPHIFKPFFRGLRAIDAQVRGTGVGLTVVRHVVDAHRGAINVDSRPGEGTAVRIELPLAAKEGSGVKRSELKRSGLKGSALRPDQS